MKEEIDAFFKLGTKVFALFWWAMLTLILFIIDYEILIQEADPNEPGIYIYLGILSIWLWTSVRWLRKKGYLGSIKSKELKRIISSSDRQEQNKFRFIPFLMKSIVAPIVVSIVIFSVTGEASVSLISVPILGFLSASIST